MVSRPARRTWTVARIRADDLAEGDVARIGGTWRWIFDIWTDAEQVRAHFGDRYPPATQIISLLADIPEGMWIVVRYLSEEHSTPAETAYGLTRLRLHDLVEVQQQLPASRRCRLRQRRPHPIRRLTAHRPRPPQGGESRAR